MRSIILQLFKKFLRTSIDERIGERELDSVKSGMFIPLNSLNFTKGAISIFK